MKSCILKITITDSVERLDQAILRTIKDLTQKESPVSRKQLKLLLHSIRLSAALKLPRGVHEIFLPTDLYQTLLSSRRQKVPALAAAGFHLPILYEDENLLILNKTSGIASLPLNEQENQTAVNFALQYEPKLQGIGTKGLEPGLVHRLDTETSGVLVFAKTQDYFEKLVHLWKQKGNPKGDELEKTKKVRKIYRAIVTPFLSSSQKTPLSLQGPFPITLDTPLARDRKSSKKMLALSTKGMPRSIRGKPLPAITQILNAKPFLDHYDLEIEIETGVMHQIRCHLSSSGLPILGDRIYSGAPASRLFLHSWKVELPLASNVQVVIEAPLPENWPGQF